MLFGNMGNIFRLRIEFLSHTVTFIKSHLTFLNAFQSHFIEVFSFVKLMGSILSIFMLVFKVVN